ncbi:MAG: hypothetical protein ACLVL7_13950 [Anaerotruncus massiliensis (ex Togo et al. 2019)]
MVAKLRGIAGTRRVGHAGTLDPMATGVLPLFSRATKACDILPRQDATRGFPARRDHRHAGRDGQGAL